MTTKQELLENGFSIECIEAALELGIALSNIEEVYAGEFNSDESFAQNLAVAISSLDNNISWPYTCIDWELAASELMYDYCEQDGYYFRNL